MIKERLSGHYLFFNGKLLKRGIVLLDENRRVIDVIDHGGKPVELPAMRYLNGVLVPMGNNSGKDANDLGKALSEKMNAGCTDLKLLLNELSQFMLQIEKGSSVEFLLLKGIDYSTLELKHPIRLTKVKWLF